MDVDSWNVPLKKQTIKRDVFQTCPLTLQGTAYLFGKVFQHSIAPSVCRFSAARAPESNRCRSG
jgi:hypothetical protein